MNIDFNKDLHMNLASARGFQQKATMNIKVEG